MQPETTGTQPPLVSVVIPTHNREELVTRAIASVLEQTCRDLECIVVDDASTDGTEAAVNGNGDARLRYLKNDTNKGAPASRNRGIREARGRYVALLDDDDEWLPEKLEKQLRLFDSALGRVGLIYSGFYYVSGKSGENISTFQPIHKGSVYPELLKGCILGSPTPLIKKECFEQAGGFDESLPGCQDWDMWLRIAKVCDFDFISEPLARHYVHGMQISANLAAKIKARTLLLQKHYGDIRKEPGILYTQLKGLAILYFLNGESRRGRRLLSQAVRNYPAQVTGYIHLLLSFVPQLHRRILLKTNVVRIDDITFYY
jgi:glycosyltransferase involved in cell wall biosynthesis